MEYGLIGKKLGHSFSKDIHESLGKYPYVLKELNEEEFHLFMKERPFLAVNVTIPYKEQVIPYLDEISSVAKQIHAVNVVINKNGKLIGHNTDYDGLKAMIEHFGFEISGKTAMILGTGGTSKTASIVLKDLGIQKIVYVSTSKKQQTISYEEVDQYAGEIDLLINTTPKEMYPNNQEEILSSLDAFTKLKGVIDVVYNPLKTNLLQKAIDKGILCCNGLYMLIAQAVYAMELFLNKQVDKTLIDQYYHSLLKAKENIVLIGMPSSGKTTISKRLSKALDRKVLDIDQEIVKEIQMDIATFFKKYGKEKFREIESTVVEKFAKENSCIIATGGGVILKEKNMQLLKQNGVIFFLNRRLDKLITTRSRPLSSSRSDLEKLYVMRYPLYQKYADYVINANLSKWIVTKSIVLKVNRRNGQ